MNTVPSTTTKHSTVLRISYDIADGTSIPSSVLLPPVVTDTTTTTTTTTTTNSTVILRLTNEKKALKTMPSIRNLPPHIIGVEFDASCTCIEAIDSEFLSHSTGLIVVDLYVLKNLATVGEQFLEGCAVLERVRFPRDVKPEGAATGADTNETNTTYVDIGSSFMKGCSALQELDLSHFRHLKVIPSGFLHSVTALRSLDLRQFKQLRTVGDYFLNNCRSLEVLELPTCSSSFSIGQRFLYRCESLEHVDLSFFEKDYVPKDFLAHCKRLKVVNFEPLKNVTTIGGSFLASCSSLASADFSSFTKLSNIGSDFLNGCTALESLQLPKMGRRGRSVLFVDSGFLFSCKSLRSIDLSLFSGLDSVPNHFLCDCHSLSEIDFSPLSDVSTIGQSFLCRCKTLKSADLRPLTKLKNIGASFMSYCTSLESLHAPRTTGMKDVGASFLTCCSQLPSVDLAFLSGLSKIDNDFMVGCTAVEHVDLSPFSNVFYIGNQFLSKCSSLSAVDVAAFSRVTFIGNGFMQECIRLQEVHNMHEGLSNIQTIGSQFMASCRSLRLVDISTWTQLNCVGHSFLRKCDSLQIVHCPPKSDRWHVRVDHNFLGDCTSLLFVDLRFLGDIRRDSLPVVERIGPLLLCGCSPASLRAVVTIPSEPAKLLIDAEVHSRLLQMEEGSTLPELQWSWETHPWHSKGVRLGVLWLFSGGLTYSPLGKATKERRHLPTEVAFEICSYISTPYSEATS